MSAQVLFRVKCSTEFSQMVRIVGNSSQLGNWNPQLGFKLMTNNEMYPIWYSDFALEVELDQLVEFKLIITDGLNSFWECGENRCLQIQGQKMVVILTYNMPSIFIYSIKRIISDNDLATIAQGRIRKVSLQLQDKLYDSDDDSDSDQESDANSIFQDEITSCNSNENISNSSHFEPIFYSEY
ncbi:unnamed protein product (macronuclear) [Paramecium tetraurelia]|uniref:CBM20 domain-containing protein n=1 Tax=Paramecium tetraurelia TaxID=5888 RepID=A0BSH7_PARTE|nr:uncharacterized protein GSPATT00031726001 [Paramecium tetraurelia]CAK61494.1 unnamed protein product [Paramecium tetraurelia]|eukprot:XP_001428892.1 hypothetical protein (macronuclear) [Paramecium tetraurelia strain d4-2]